MVFVVFLNNFEYILGLHGLHRPW